MAERPSEAAVLGSGVMGSAIAAHLAGAGIKTHLLDMVPKEIPEGEDRNTLAAKGLERALKAKPALFFDPGDAQYIRVGNFDDHLDRLKQCDLVVEAVVERMDIKQSLFQRIAPHLGEKTILASNTSGLSVAEMNASLPEALRSRFVVMHFFNPVRYMHLLEIVAGPDTSPEVLSQAADIGDYLGKGVVYAKDTANFVANRIGIHSVMTTLQEMTREGATYTIEQVDKIVGLPMGRSKSAAFKTADMVGIDLFLHVAKNCYDALPDDEERELFKIPEWVVALVEKGNLGRKSGAGFYKKTEEGILVLDVARGEYRAQNKVRYDSLGAVRNIEDPGQRLKTLVAADDPAGHLAWRLTARTLCYAARRVGEIADDVLNIDRAMRWGFNWQMGPFEAWDAIGVRDSVKRMQDDGMEVPKWVLQMLESGQENFYGREEGRKNYYDVSSGKSQAIERDARKISLAELKEDKSKVLKSNLGASLVDLGDGVLCVEVHTKMNTVDADVVQMMNEGVRIAERDFEALVVGNDGEHFGAGANLLLIFMAAQQKEWGQIETVAKQFQNALQGMRYAKVPVVTAPFQYAFGGGAEIAMAGDACQAHAETYIGLVEVGVGLVPAGGGCLRLIERYTGHLDGIEMADVLPFIGQASLQIAMAKVATGAHEAKHLRYLRFEDGITLNREHLLYEAKQRALGLARSGYRPPRPVKFRAAGQDAAKTIGARVWAMVEGGYASEHDGLVANKVAHILCGGNVAAGTLLSDQDYLDLEREAFISLCGEEKSQARMQSILTTNKPLRN